MTRGSFYSHTGECPRTSRCHENKTPFPWRCPLRPSEPCKLHDRGSATTYGGDDDHYYSGNCEVHPNAYSRDGREHHHDANLSHLL